MGVSSAVAPSSMPAVLVESDTPAAGQSAATCNRRLPAATSAARRSSSARACESPSVCRRSISAASAASSRCSLKVLRRLPAWATAVSRWPVTLVMTPACRSTCHQSRPATSNRAAITLDRIRVIAQPLQAQIPLGFPAPHQTIQNATTGIHPARQLVACADKVASFGLAQQGGGLERASADVEDEATQRRPGCGWQLRQVTINCSQGDTEVRLQQRLALRFGPGLPHYRGGGVAVTDCRDAYRIHVPDQLASLEVADHRCRHGERSGEQ